MRPKFRGIGFLVEEAEKHSPFEAGSLPDSEKERLCRMLLSEFGISRIRVREPDGELIHACLVGQHGDQERNPSASLNYRKLTYKCLGCSQGGGLLWFIATARGDDTTSEARKWVEDQTGFGADDQSLGSIMQYLDAVYGTKDNPRPTPISKMSPRVLEPWLAIHPYLTEDRGIPEANVMAFQVGYAPDYLVGRTDLGEPIRSERIVLPHFWQGDLVGWQTRRIYSDGSPKYKSSPDFPKDTTLFNHDPKRTAIVVESPMSTVAAFDIDDRLEATFGANVTEAQTRLLAEHPRVILWFDNDEAGWAATEAVGDALMAYTDVWAVDSPWIDDPADLVKKNRADEVRRLIAEAVPYAVWRAPKRVEEVERWPSSSTEKVG